MNEEHTPSTPPVVSPTPPAMPAQPVSKEKPLVLSERPSLREWIEALLRHPKGLGEHPATGNGRALAGFLTIAFFSLLVFGLVLGSFAYHEQLWAAPVKLMAGTLFAALICFPSLYIFAALAGAEVSVPRLAGFLGGMLALSGMLMLGFAPAVWIFTQASESLGFIGLLALGAWIIAMVFGLQFLFAALRVNGAAPGGPLMIWAVIFLLVCLQLTTTLRPILGRSDRFLTTEKKFFLEHWFDTMDKSLTTPPGRGKD